MRYLAFILLLLPFCCTAQSGAKLVYQEDSSIKIFAYGSQRLLGWSGGFNAPQFAQADLNKDGLKDLVVFEAYDGVIKTFLNRGTSTAAQYVYAPVFAKNFPVCADYLKLEDYNRDGIADLIHKGIGGFAVYKGYYNGQNQLCFNFYRELRYNSPSIIGSVNAYSQPGDIPGVADVDGDGDLDFFGYNVTGGLITFYKNCQVELGLPKDSIRICVPSNCWGHALQAYYRTYLLGVVPAHNSPYCDDFGTFSCRMVNGQQMYKEARHQGNCMLVFDYDGDGDADLLDGNISFPDLQMLTNGRAQYGGTDSMISQDTLWQSGGHKLNLYQWPAAFYADADGDGKRDLLISPHDAAAGENYKTVVFYRNTGSAAAPQFTYQNDTFLVDKTVDMGTGSYPVLYDYNRDGRRDLFVGSDGFFTPGGTFRSRIAYYQNSVVNGVTRFTLVTNDFGGIGTQSFQGAAPAFGDLDGDGLDDMVIGHSDGTMSFYKNTAFGNNVQPQWTLSQLMLKGALNDTLDAGYYAAPLIYDMNKDGKPDLLVGNQSGRISYYQNAPAAGQPGLTLGTNKLGDIETVPGNFAAGFSTIWIGKMDAAGPELLVCGNGAGNLLRYSGFQTGNVTAPYTLVDSNYNGIDVGQRSAPAIGDADSDGVTDIILGNRLGGLNLFKLGPAPTTTGIAGYSPITGNCMMYPNPAHDEVVITWNDAFAAPDAPLRVTLHNALGQIVLSSDGAASRRAVTLNVAGLPAGVYTCRIEAPGALQSLKLSVMR